MIIVRNMTRKKIRLYSTAALLITAFFTWLFYNYTLDIEQQIYRNEVTLPKPDAGKKEVVYIGVISRYPPNVIYRGYQPMLDYISSRSKYRFELRLSEDYNQAVNMLIRKEVAASFLGSYLYVRANKMYGVVPILKPLNENREPFSRSVLFTGANSGIFSINDLKGKNIALPSKESYSANWLLSYVFKKNNLAEKELKGITNFPHHQSVIYNVMRGSFDAGVSRENLVKKIQDNSIRVLMYSDPFPSSPLVAAKDYPKDIIETIKRVLLSVKPGKDNPVTKGWDNEFVYGFVTASDSDYNVIRTIINER